MVLCQRVEKRKEKSCTFFHQLRFVFSILSSRVACDCQWDWTNQKCAEKNKLQSPEWKWNYCCEKKREEFVRVNIIFLYILYGSVIDSGESTTNRRRSQWVWARQPISCVLYSQKRRRIRKKKLFSCVLSLCVVFGMMNKDGSIGLEPGAETVYGTDDTTMVMSEKV